MSKPKFCVSFDLTSEYFYEGKTYVIRVGAHPINSSKEYFPTLVKCIGTVMFKSSEDFQTFPPKDVVQMFSAQEGVHLVAGKWSSDFTELLCNGERGPLWTDEHGSVYLREYIQLFRELPAEVPNSEGFVDHPAEGYTPVTPSAIARRCVTDIVLDIMDRSGPVTEGWTGLTRAERTAMAASWIAIVQKHVERAEKARENPIPEREEQELPEKWGG